MRQVKTRVRKVQKKVEVKVKNRRQRPNWQFPLSFDA
jgi:hypothetical protein